MDNTTLDEISAIFFLDNYFDMNSHIAKRQEEYIESRIKLFWRLPLIRHFTASKVVLMSSAPSIKLSDAEGECFNVFFSQKVMLVGKSQFWALLLLKRRKKGHNTSFGYDTRYEDTTGG